MLLFGVCFILSNCLLVKVFREFIFEKIWDKNLYFKVNICS